ncbi:DNA alkylation repair protein [Pedobacter nutrimenti]|uniref:3-methyladenine DNA glycosylase AlkC n=1 Tax=Pedobacter nutrimenti TaxID=1241337 RepID=A0A318UDN8_9SPHI|nr:DNA alkylation repair protein [Pedobacter nutrimenti]PYF71580.1 3-methyladenine DNA glycosylase AlkC [Pedobacter nutrimenti]
MPSAQPVHLFNFKLWVTKRTSHNKQLTFMGLLKDIYSETFYRSLAGSLAEVLPDFDKTLFLKKTCIPDFCKMELKQRMRHTTNVIHEFLSADFPIAASQLKALIVQLKKDGIGGELVFIFLPDYIECHGLEHFEASVEAIEFVTQFISCEFAVRPFLLKYGQRMIKQMEIWSLHENHKVRRLATEGCRPRLPWAMALPELKKDPTPILPILENLKNDPSDFVRKSVANNLNDISKDHPQVVLGIAALWKGISKETDAIIKHGCRTLLKQGHPDILAHYTLDSSAVEWSNFQVLSPEVAIGKHLEFSFHVKNTSKKAQIIRLEYALYYKRLNGQPSKKVFKISEKSYLANEGVLVKRKQSFKIITTRKFYPGPHQLSVIVNGSEKELKTFVLTEAE